MRYRARAPLRLDFGGGWTDAPFYADEEGGAVINAGISPFVHGFIARPEAEGFLKQLRGERSYVSYSCDLPQRAGLGASAAQTVLWVTLVKTSVANVSERRDIAEIACRIDGMLDTLIGKQDEYASALGGIALYTFGDSVGVDRLALDPPLVDRLRARLLLAYTGPIADSRALRDLVRSRYLGGERGVAPALAALKRLAAEMAQALQNRDLDGFADLMTENWVHQRSLAPQITTEAIDRLVDVATRNGAASARACGTGGGGCVLLMSRADEPDRLRAALERERVRLIDFEFDSYGVFLTKG